MSLLWVTIDKPERCPIAQPPGSLGVAKWWQRVWSRFLGSNLAAQFSVMTARPLLVFDFDGVIVDGMAEYWWSAWMAAQRLNAEPQGLGPDQVPQGFRRLRPWVHHGWEMVLLAAEMPRLDPERWIKDYGPEQALALQRRGWSASQLQEALDEVRQQAVASDRAAWLGLHHPSPVWWIDCRPFRERGGWAAHHQDGCIHR